MQNSARLQQERLRQQQAGGSGGDEYDIEAQRKIEEAIRQEAVLENMESAMENMTESWASFL